MYRFFLSFDISVLPKAGGTWVAWTGSVAGQGWWHVGGHGWMEEEEMIIAPQVKGLSC